MRPRPVIQDTRMPALRFYCDEMLGRLARYLRAAGFDTLLASDGAPDALILRQAIHETRWLLTMDRQIMEHRAAQDHVILFPRGELDDHAALLSARFGLDWIGAAFTRCLVDNAPLCELVPGQRERIPLYIRSPDRAALSCPTCGRIYWQGSHSRRMRDRLQRWQGPRPDANLTEEPGA